MNKEINNRRMILAAMFLAITLVLPFFTGQIQQIGNMLCPMHIPVLLCGFICGGSWGFLVGLIAPLLRSVTLGMPLLFPTAFCMAVELAAYGSAAGFFYRKFPKKKGYIYASLLIAMIVGRIAWGMAMFVCLGLSGSNFGFSAFLAGAVTNAIPGIVLQIILVPILVMILNSRKEIIEKV